MSDTVAVLQTIVGLGLLVLFFAVVVGIPLFIVAWVIVSWHYQPGRLALAFLGVWVVAGIAWFVLTHPWISASIVVAVLGMVVFVLRRLRSAPRPAQHVPAEVDR